jgi:hypothetical protein
MRGRRPTHPLRERKTPRSTRGHPTPAAKGSHVIDARWSRSAWTPDSESGDRGSNPRRAARPPWRNGRRTRLRPARPHGHAGSTPAGGTHDLGGLAELERHRVATPWSGTDGPGARSIRAPSAHTEVEHGGLCSALMRRRIRFDSWHLDVYDGDVDHGSFAVSRRIGRAREGTRLENGGRRDERRAGSNPASSAQPRPCGPTDTTPPAEGGDAGSTPAGGTRIHSLKCNWPRARLLLRRTRFESW